MATTIKIKVSALLKLFGKTKSELAQAIKETTRVSTIRIKLEAGAVAFDGVRDGGTWDDAYRLSVEDFTAKFFHGMGEVHVNRNPFNGSYTTHVGMSRGTVLVRHAYSCGKDLGLTMYVHPLDMAEICGGSDTRRIREPAILADSLFDEGQEAASNLVRAIFCGE